MHNKIIKINLTYLTQRFTFKQTLPITMLLNSSLGGTVRISLLVLCLLSESLVMCGKLSRSIDAATGSSIMNIPRDVSTSSVTTILFKNTTLDTIPVPSVPTSTINQNTTELTQNSTINQSTEVPVSQIINQSTTTTTTTTTTNPLITQPNNIVPVIAVLPPVDDCPNLSTIPDLDLTTQEEFSTILTDTCRYDRFIKPPDHLVVNFRFDMTHIESADYLQLKAHMLVQLRYRDERLRYKEVSPRREIIIGEQALRNKLWVPHIIMANEKESSLMGLSAKDVFVQIFPDGEVIFTYRMSTLFYCWMNLKKFPFDFQVCDITWVSWAYNSSNLTLKWEQDTPFVVAQNLHLTEFVVEDKWTEYSLHPNNFKMGRSVGGSSAHFSAITFKMKLRREVGYYIMDYFLPSILLVCTSWVTFWLQADAAPPRVTLGASTMLSFITLNGGLSKNLPKVSYIKASEIWFLACASFIFFSLAEFAFVNVIWRRKKKVEMKKNNTVHILKGALTPSLARKQLRKASSMNSLHKARSCSSLDREIAERNTQANYLTVHSFPSSLIVPTITHSQDELIDSDRVTTIPIPELQNNPTQHHTFTTMTPQEVAIWIDKKSRIVFPVAFIIFNIFYWSFVYAL
ncbi:unnamed protein product [Psylliodes chrysocephalus]|uniref:pH-sensitive chloride channel 2 n=1 Tax=Psylliodes chrysocephalus TaxID=3402493 RepID=A0A9P0CL00_9CUCU|nr:unnamed protein product [Psylliodes chrysocephala]